jgi:hypothetical protein
MKRHKWEESSREPHRTVRTCLNGCGVLKISRHEVENGRDIHWQEFWRGTDRIGTVRPECVPIDVEALA